MQSMLCSWLVLSWGEGSRPLPTWQVAQVACDEVVGVPQYEFMTRRPLPPLPAAPSRFGTCGVSPICW